MEADIGQIKRSLQLLFQEGDTIELRCVGNQTINGFYRDPDKLAQDAHHLNSALHPPENCYVCLNPTLPELYARRAERCAVCKKGESVRDADVVCRRWLLIDVDPVRPAGVSATDAQKQKTTELAQHVYSWLQEQLGEGCIVVAGLVVAAERAQTRAQTRVAAQPAVGPVAPGTKPGSPADHR